MPDGRMIHFLLGFAVLLVLGAAAPADAAGCRGCEVFGESCTTNCLELNDRNQLAACLSACDGAAAACSCDGPATLSSEEAVRLGLAEGPSSLGGACHGNVSCPAEFSSCAGWSSYSDCGDPFCGTFKFCGDPPGCYEPDICNGPALRTYRERFRVCFNGAGQSCTEYQQNLDPMPVGMQCGC